MPRYFFHIHDGIDMPDREGTELADVREARSEAVRHAGTTIADHAKTAQLGEDWSMEVTDEGGLVLFRLDFLMSTATMGLDRKTS